MLAVRYKKKGVSYHAAIDAWLAAQRPDVVFVFVQYIGVTLGAVPRVYVARPPELAAHLKAQWNGQGYGSLQEDFKRDHPKSRYDHKIPASWVLCQKRIDAI